MPLHLIKLSVGSETVKSLTAWQERVSFSHESGDKVFIHGTTQAPKRTVELLAGGSIFWIIKGMIMGRNPLVAIEVDETRKGRARCSLVCALPLVPVIPKRHRIFQGWRYFDGAAAPRDMPPGMGGKVSKAGIPAELAGELADLGLL